MAKLIMMFNNQVIKEIPLGKESMAIGREPGNDIEIDNLAVSSHHARLDKAGPLFTLTDLQSTNGTYVNDKKIISYNLRHGDKILIGKHTLVFLTSEEGESEQTGLDKTMVLDTAQQRDLLAKQKPRRSPVQEPKKIGVLAFFGHPKLGQVELTKKLTRIGKSRQCEVRLPGIFMGATAATISKRPSGYTMTFIGGRKKVRVNGKILMGSLPLKDFDTVEVGSYKFQFYQREIK